MIQTELTEAANQNGIVPDNDSSEAIDNHTERRHLDLLTISQVIVFRLVL